MRAAGGKGINCESHIIVNGGRTTVLNTGNGTYDSDEREAKGAAGIKADSTFTINGGELWLKSTWQTTEEQIPALSFLSTAKPVTGN